MPFAEKNGSESLKRIKKDFEAVVGGFEASRRIASRRWRQSIDDDRRCGVESP